MFSKLLEWLGGLLAGAFGLLFMLFGLLSLPLSVIALMRWFDLTWWAALLAAIFVNVIPIVGQLAFFVFAIAGGYYLVADDFSFERASSGTMYSAQQSKSPGSIRDALYTMCAQRGDGWVRNGVRLSASDLKTFCDCSSFRVYESLTLQEIEYWQKYRKQTDEFQRLSQQAIRDCMQGLP